QRSRATPLLVLAATLALAGGTAAVAGSPNLQAFQDPTGIVRTYSTSGSIDTANPFFQSLGTNGRSCGTCHQQGDAWSVTPPHLLDRFNKTNGTDPIFRTNDGSNSPNADVSTVAARRSAYSMLLGKGVIRVRIRI